ncbi:MAG: hypothetical protein H6841_07890 [Planctomycetes bacterium]|nr:hypothetical protein [Planctomycetota bacterium]MCB9935484.1 hypothetical protein [Planctomycetota bacterium]
MKATRWPASVLIALALALTLVVAQELPEPPPEGQPKKKEGSLQPRPDNDPKTELWVAGLGAARARTLSTEPGVLMGHVLSPDGERFYYYRELPASDAAPRGNRYALFTVGAEKAETKVADTGADATPPIFLEDGRILFTTRRYDLNEDGLLDENDDATLMVGNRDGGNLRNVATLQPGETPLAVWKQDREVLLNCADDEDANGWITSLNLVRGDRTRLVRAFNVELVLDDGRLLVESLVAPEPDKGKPVRFNPWNPGQQPEDKEEQELQPTLLDATVHSIYDPEQKTTVKLYAGGGRSRFVVSAEGSFFGHQEPSEPEESNQYRGNWGPETVSKQLSELLIVDDPQHHDTRSPSARYDYQALGWIPERGLLVIEQGNLGSRLLLFDRALKAHRLAEFELNACGFIASRDGLTIGWLEVEDTDKNGYLEPWKDHSRVNLIRIE